MGKQRQLAYIENIATTLMGQLKITDDEVGVDTYENDLISGRIRKRLHLRVFLDIRHMKVETLARIASCGDPGHPLHIREQDSGRLWDDLRNGKARCTMNHAMYEHWLTEINTLLNPTQVLQYMAASAIIAAMYDIVVRKRLPKSKAS